MTATASLVREHRPGGGRGAGLDTGNRRPAVGMRFQPAWCWIGRRRWRSAAERRQRRLSPHAAGAVACGAAAGLAASGVADFGAWNSAGAVAVTVSVGPIGGCGVCASVAAASGGRSAGMAATSAFGAAAAVIVAESGMGGATGAAPPAAACSAAEGLPAIVTGGGATPSAAVTVSGEWRRPRGRALQSRQSGYRAIGFRARDGVRRDRRSSGLLHRRSCNGGCSGRRRKGKRFPGRERRGLGFADRCAIIGAAAPAGTVGSATSTPAMAVAGFAGSERGADAAATGAAGPGAVGQPEPPRQGRYSPEAGRCRVQPWRSPRSRRGRRLFRRALR